MNARTGTRRGIANAPKVKDRLSDRVVAVVLLTSSTLGVTAYPFVFDAFGARDNPFDRPIELVWISLLALGAGAVLVGGIYLRRVLLGGLRA